MTKKSMDIKGIRGKSTGLKNKKAKLRTFVVKSSDEGVRLAMNRHSSERDRVLFSEMLIEDSRQHTQKRLTKLQRVLPATKRVLVK